MSFASRTASAIHPPRRAGICTRGPKTVKTKRGLSTFPPPPAASDVADGGAFPLRVRRFKAAEKLNVPFLSQRATDRLPLFAPTGRQGFGRGRRRVRERSPRKAGDKNMGSRHWPDFARPRPRQPRTPTREDKVSWKQRRTTLSYGHVGLSPPLGLVFMFHPAVRTGNYLVAPPKRDKIATTDPD